MASSDTKEVLEQWDKKINSDRLKLKYSGAYYKFETFDQVLSEGTDRLVNSNADIKADTPCILTSCSKVFTGTAVMRTMQLKPDDWYPQKPMHEFDGWGAWRDFPIYDNVDTDTEDGKNKRIAPVITVHHLLTHTSGWPFGLQGKRETILNMPLYFEPGTNFGYSIGHRILGWMLLDFWTKQPEGKGFRNLNDVFGFLVYEPLGMSKTGTYFIDDKFETPHSIMGEFFNMHYFDNPNDDGDDNPADLALASTGNDMMKLAMMALRRGVLEDGTVYIEKWDDWAATNQLPGGKLSKALSNWRMERHEDINFLWRTLVTRTVNAGLYGWSYFGATYHDVPGDFEGYAGEVIAVGWKGFSSCGLRADYAQSVAFVAMQECVPDSRNRNFSECLREGRCGRFQLGDVAKVLSQVNARTINTTRANDNGLHNVMTEVNEPDRITGICQSAIRMGYRLALPRGVKVLKYHKSERLGKKKYLRAPGFFGRTVRRAPSSAPLLRPA